jgi:hypothetical protein
VIAASEARVWLSPLGGPDRCIGRWCKNFVVEPIAIAFIYREWKSFPAEVIVKDPHGLFVLRRSFL